MAVSAEFTAFLYTLLGLAADLFLILRESPQSLPLD
jgi:hypothetical protein